MFILILNSSSINSVQNINLNRCENHIGKNFGQKYKVDLILDDLLEYYFSNKNVEKEKEWQCSNCKIKQNITKKLSLFYLPRLLIIFLNRNSNKGNKIIFPFENLDIGKYICDDSPDRYLSKYDLLAVSYFMDNGERKQYETITKNINGKWYYSDSHVSIDKKKIIDDLTSYIFIYRKKKC